MANKRIKDYNNKGTANDLTLNDHVDIDQDAVGGSTLDVKLVEYIDYVDSVSESKKQGALSKDANNNLILTTKYKSVYGQNVKLKDGMKIEVLITDISFDWQNKLSPTLEVDNLGAKPVYNKVFKFDITGDVQQTVFNRNTIARGTNIFEYNSTLNAWLWSHSDYTSGKIYYFASGTQRAGFIRLDGAALPNGSRLDYPILDALDWFRDSVSVHNMADSCIVGATSISPADEVKEGQVESFKTEGEFFVADGSFSNTVGTSGNPGFVSISDSGSLQVIDTSNLPIQTAQKIRMSLGSINKGTKTAGPRLGRYLFLKA